LYFISFYPSVTWKHWFIYFASTYYN